ncbi:MAG: DUF1614 domain-containing protein [Chloroflexi bacterium]|nr:DUF1614 domain-containing protein [Chloroflexota bacterium]
MENFLIVVFALLVLFVLVFLFFQVVSISFVRLGIPASLVGILMIAILVGSFINIPVFTVSEESPAEFFRLGRMVFRAPPSVTTTVIAVNVGGALVPLGLSLFLLFKAPLFRTLVGIAIVAAISYALARAVPGEGILLNPFIPPVAAALSAMALAWRQAAPVAYISGVVGTIIGADLLHLHELLDGQGTFLSIGGAGVFDGIFLVGIIAAFLSPGSPRGRARVYNSIR